MRARLLPLIGFFLVASCSKTQTPRPTAPYSHITSIAVVDNHKAAIAWYESWIGRAPDLVPMAGIAEWKLTDSAWLQVSVAEHAVGQTSIAIGVSDLQEQVEKLDNAKVTHTPIVDHGFIRIFETKDPAGNTIVFVQETDATQE